MKSIQEIIKSTPRASFANPYIKQDRQTGEVTIKAGSPADACRYIAALRAEGYTANPESPRDGQTIKAR